MHATGHQHIGNQYRDSSQELQEGSVDAGDTFNKLIQQNNGGVQNGGTQTEGNTDGVISTLAQIHNAGHQCKANGGHDKTEDLLFGDLFV